MIGTNPHFQEKLFSALKINDPMEQVPLLQWTRLHRANLTLGRAFDMINHKYLEAIYSDDSREIVVCKAGQVGISEYLISYSLWSCDIRNATVLYLFPTDTHVSDFSAARIGAAIKPEVSPYLFGIVSSQDSPGKSVDRVGLKRVRNRYMYLRGATIRPDGRTPQLRAVDADVVVLDEYDEMSPMSEPLARERLGHSQIAEVRIVSTPTYSTVGIWQVYQKTDQRVWHIRCDKCNLAQPLELDNLVLEWDNAGRPSVWNEDRDGKIYLACRRCAEPLNRLNRGEWIPRFPDKEIHGYHLSRLFMPHKPLSSIIEGLSSLDEYVRQQTYNQALGLPYRPRASNSLTPEILDACRREYTQGLDFVKNFTFAGVDVGSVIHIVIRQLFPDGHDEAMFVGTVREFDEVGMLLKRYHVKTCVIDALPETRSARELQASLSMGIVWLAYYTEKKKTEPSETWNIKEQVVDADRTRTLDDTFARFSKAAMGEPGKTLPADARAAPDYYVHLCALERVLKRGIDGNMSPTYVGEPDHYAHAENYCNIAMRCPVAANWSRGPG